MSGDPGGQLTILTDTRTAYVALERDCRGADGCAALVDRDFRDTFYTAPQEPLSIVNLPATGDEYVFQCSRCVRQNARVSARKGYFHAVIDRSDWIDDLYTLRSSAAFRQGRSMPPAYMRRQEYGTDRWPDPFCLRHLDVFHGVIGADGHLRGYVHLVQTGELVRFNTILGHWDRLNDSVMWLLVLDALRWHIDTCGARFALYYTHDSGHGDGLRYFKERFGMRPTSVRWLP